LLNETNFHVVKVTVGVIGLVYRKTHSENDRYRIRAVDRALAILGIFLSCDGPASVTEISRRMDLDLGTTFRMLVTLEAQDFVEQDHSTGKYQLGVTCLELGNKFLKDNDLRKRALPVMEALRDEFGETVHLAMLDKNEVVYLEKVAGLHPIGLMASRVGNRAPAYCTGVGKALLAYLPEEMVRRCFSPCKLTRYTDFTITKWDALRKELARTRAQGYAIDQQEHEMGVKCVAVPIFDHRAVAAAMSVAGPVERMERHIEQEKLIERLQSEATHISEQMGGKLIADQLDQLEQDFNAARTKMFHGS
jgi:DNA-binding IclR family transcriptional regulator